ncbi:MAG: MFS transporter [Chloroflexi bacterium]|nr:MFS transporter [Chloroflexota bacterium]
MISRVSNPVPDYRSITASLAGTFVLRVASAVMGSMIQLYFGYIDRSVYPLSATMRGLALAVFFIPELIGAPVLGAWSDRYGRKFFIWFSSLTGGIAVQIAALTTNFGALIVTRLLTGLSTASAFPATLGLLSAETSSDESLRGRAMGLFQLATIGGTVVGILIGGRMWDVFHAHAFTLNHAIYLVSLAIFFFGIRERTRKDAKKHERTALDDGARALRQSLDRYRDVFLAPVVLRFAPAWLTINVILGIWLNQIIGQLIAPRHRFPDQLLFGILGESASAGTLIALAMLALATIFVGGVIGWSWVLGKMRRTTVMLIGAGGMFALCAMLFALNHRATLADPAIPFLVAGALSALFLVSGLMPASLTYLADVTEARANDRGAIMGMYTIFFGAGQFVGTLLGGPFADWAAIDGILFITVLLGIFIALTLWRLHRAELRAILTKDRESDK